jgi:hypothetical protein
MRWLLVLLLVASQAAADPLPTIDSTFPPGIRVNGALVAKGAVKSVKVEEGEVTWVTIVVLEDYERAFTLDVPPGTHVVGMAFDDGSGPKWAARLPRWDAASDFYHVQTRALAEPAGSSYGEDHYMVRTYDSGTFSFALCATCEGIDAETSLVLEPKHRAADFNSSPDAVMWLPYLDKAIIRRVVQFQMLQFRRCLMVVAQRDRVDGNVQLDFLIRPDGTTTDMTVETAPQLASAHDCLVDVIATLEFPATATQTEVHYPLTFKLDR